jgi:hypothetical protein
MISCAHGHARVVDSDLTTEQLFDLSLSIDAGVASYDPAEDCPAPDARPPWHWMNPPEGPSFCVPRVPKL